MDFFKTHNINFDDLEEIPFRYRDSSIHYYHPKTDTIYSKNIFTNKWYIPRSATSIKFRYTQPEAYEKQQEAIRDSIDESCKAYKEYLSQYLSEKELLNKHMKNGFLVISKQLIKDIIDNKHYKVCTLGLFSYETDVYYYETNQTPDLDLVGPDYQHTLPTSEFQRRWDFMYDFQYESPLFIKLGGDEAEYAPIDQDFILTTLADFFCYTPYPWGFYTKDPDGNFIGAPNVKFKGIRANLKLIGNCKGALHINNDYIFQSQGGILRYRKFNQHTI